jgi:hypothetical protein
MRFDLEVNDALNPFLHSQWGARPEQINHPSSDEHRISKAGLTERVRGLFEGGIHVCDARLGPLIWTMRELGR